MNRKYRLARSIDIKRVRREGKSYVHPLIVLVTCPNGQETVRIGVIAGKSVGGAVHRNRVKRLLREAIRPKIPTLVPGQDILILARKSSDGLPFSKIQEAVDLLVMKAKLDKATHAS